MSGKLSAEPISAVRLSQAHLTEMQRHVEAAYPEEGCGLLVGCADRGVYLVHEVVPTANVWAAAEERRARFLIAPEAFVQVDRAAAARGWEVIGSFHSHPDHPPLPSETDRAFAWHGWVMLILSLRARQLTEARAWQWDEEAGVFKAVDVVSGR